jgi:type I restriction enzyme S subunit
MEVREGYKQTEVGVIPEDWEVKELDEIGSFKKGKGIRKDEVISDGIPCVRYGELYTLHHEYIKGFSSFISSESAKKSQKLNKGDLLFAGSGETKEEIGKCAAFLDDREAYAGGDVIILSPRKTNPLLLGFILNHELAVRQKAQLAQGDAVVHIYPNNLSSISIPLPPTKAEQTAIATALSDADALIQSLEKLIAKKRNIKQGAMQELLKPKEGWVVKKLGKVAFFSNGKAHEQFIDEAGNYIVVNSKLISTEGKIFKNASVSLCPLNAGDITMVMSDIPNGKALAKCFIIPKSGKYTLNQRICALRSELVDNNFLAYIINRNKYFLAFDSGTGQTNLKKKEVLDCPIPLPSTNQEQTRIATILSDMDAEIAALEIKLEKYKQIKQGMMQELLTGRTRLV